MTTEYVIIDASVKFINAPNPLFESLYYAGESGWLRHFSKALKYPDANSAIEVARKLHIECPVKVLLLQIEGNKIGVGEVKF